MPALAARLMVLAFLALASLALAPAHAGGPRTRPEQARLDRHGDPLPAGALARLGTLRYRTGESSLSSAVLSPDGKTLALAGPRSFHLLEAATGKERRTFPATAGVTCLAFTPDSQRLVTADPLGGISSWECSTGKLLGRTAVLPRRRLSFVLSADGKTLATTQVNSGEPPVVIVLEVLTGKRRGSFEVLPSESHGAALSPDGAVLATWSAESRGNPETTSTIQLWDVAAGKELRRLKTDEGRALARGRGRFGGRGRGGLRQATSAAFARDGKTLATSDGNGSVCLWEVATGKRLRRLAARRGVGASLTFAPDGKTLAATGRAGEVQLWEAATGKRLGLYEGPGERVTSLAFPRAGRPLACGVTGQAFCVWDVLAEKPLVPPAGHQHGVDALLFSADGKTVLSASLGARIGVWDAATGRDLRRLDLGTLPLGPGRRISFRGGGVMFSPDGKYALSSSGFFGAARLWELPRGKGVCDFPMENGRELTAAFSSDGATLAITGRAGAIHLWDVTSGEELRQLRGLSGEATGLVFSPDGKTVTALCPVANRQSQDNDASELRQWETATGKERWQSSGVRAGVVALAASPDGRLLAAIGRGEVSLWDAARGHIIRSLPIENSSSTSLLAFAPDGRILALAVPAGAGTGGKVQLWEVASGTLRRQFEGHKGEILALAFAPDGQTLATGSMDTTVLLWDVTGRRTGHPAPPATWQARELEAAWSVLAAADAARAYPVMRRLAGAPAAAVPFLARRLQPVPPVDPRQLARWLADLKGERFAARNQATKQLARLGVLVAVALNQALVKEKDLEARRRLEQLLARLRWQVPSPEELRVLRALEVLELAGTVEARTLVQKLAQGAPGARLTEDARAVLKRSARP